MPNEDTINQYAGQSEKWTTRTKVTMIFLEQLAQKTTTSVLLVTIQLEVKPVVFYIDTGAEVSVITDTIYEEIGSFRCATRHAHY